MRYPRGSKVLQLTRGHTTIVDKVLHPFLKDYTWHAHVGKGGGIYARTSILGKKVYLHRLVVECLDVHIGSLQVDHIDRNPLNNMLCNLRVVTSAVNNANRRSYRKRSITND